jgi:chemotaxis protein histidine kinase CheA
MQRVFSYKTGALFLVFFLVCSLLPGRFSVYAAEEVPQEEGITHTVTFASRDGDCLFVRQEAGDGTTENRDGENTRPAAESATSAAAEEAATSAETAATAADKQEGADTAASETSDTGETAAAETAATAADTQEGTDTAASGTSDTGETVAVETAPAGETILPENAAEGAEAEESPEITAAEAATTESGEEAAEQPVEQTTEQPVDTVSVSVQDGMCLTAADIPEAVPKEGAGSFSHWEDDAGHSYSTEELMTLPVKEDTVYYALLQKQEAAQPDLCRIGSGYYGTLAEAFQAINDGRAEDEEDGSYAVFLLVPETTADTTARLETGHDVVLSKDPSVAGEAVIRRDTAFVRKDNALIETAAGSHLKITDIVLDGSGIQENNAPVIRCQGNLTLSGDAQIRNNLTLGSDPAEAGAIRVDGGIFTMEDEASIHDCTAGTGAAAVYVSGTGSHFTMTGGRISGNHVLNREGSYGAVYAGASCESQLTGGDIADNDSAASHGGFFNDGGRLSIGGGITITGNRAECVYAGNDLQDPGISMNLELGNGEPFTLESPLTGRIGITSPGNMHSGGKIADSEAARIVNTVGKAAGMDTGSAFDRLAAAFGLVPLPVQAAGTAADTPADTAADTAEGTAADTPADTAADTAEGTAAETAAASAEVSVDTAATEALGTANLFSDTEESLTAVVEQDTGDIVLLAQATVYVCKIGNTGYTTLQAAVNAAGSGAVIELLKDITLSSTVTISGKNITITKAAENAAVLPYEGTAGSTPQIIRAAGNTGNHLLNIYGSSHLTISHVRINANNISTANPNITCLRISGGSTVTMDTGSSIVNANGYQGAAAYVDGASNLIMQSDSTISSCTCRNAGAVDISAGSVFTMKGTSSIRNCTGTETSSAIFVRGSGSPSTVNLTENASLTGNNAQSTGPESSTICMHNGAGTINISGNASITGNTGYFSGAVRVPTGCTLNMTGGRITGNTVKSGSNALSGAIGALSGATVNLSGNPAISGNTNLQTAAQKDLYLAVNSLLKVSGNLTSGASVGIFCPNYMTSGSVFGNTTASSALSVSGLDALFNDNNTGSAADLYGMAGAGSQVIWGRKVFLGLDKKVTGNMGDRSQAFNFSMSLKTASGTNLSGTYACFLNGSGTAHSIVFTNGSIASLDGTAVSTVSLKSGERILIRGLPYGVQYTVTELADAAKGYTVSHTVTDLDLSGNPTSTVSSPEAGTVAQGNITDISRQVDFVNQRSATVPTGIHDNILPFIGMVVFSITGALYCFIGLLRTARTDARKGK